MNVYDLQLSFGTEVPDKISLNIYLSGCINNKKCDRSLCQNKLLHSFKSGIDYKSDLIYNDIRSYLNKCDIIDSICLLGGEPLDQPLNLLKDFVNDIHEMKHDILFYCYTGYDYEDRKDLIDTYVKELSITDIYIGHFSKDENNQFWLSTGVIK